MEGIDVTFERSRDSVACRLIRSKIERVTEVNHHVQEIKIIYSQVAEQRCVVMVNDYGSN